MLGARTYEFHLLFGGVPVLVDDLHLLEDRALARLARAEEEHFNHLGLHGLLLGNRRLRLGVDLGDLGVNGRAAARAAHERHRPQVEERLACL